MNRRSLVLAGLRHHWRKHLGVLLGCAVATATLVGALVVGDSVRYTLGRRAEGRTGGVDLMLGGTDRFFRAALAEDLAVEGARLAPVLALPAVASADGGRKRVLDVRVHGVDESFFALSPSGRAVALPEGRACLLSEALARRLEVAEGEELVLRLDRPSAIPRDMALAPDDVSTALRLRVDGVLGREDFAEFGFAATPTPPANLFLPLAVLQEELELEDRANLVLAGVDSDDVVERLEASLRERWTPADAELELYDAEGPGSELLTHRIFFDPPIVRALTGSDELANDELTGIFTYFVNELSAGERAVPYSMAAGVGRLRAGGEPSALAALAPDAAGGMVLNQWAADDLAVAPGDTVTLRYYVVDPSRKLVEREHSFALERVVPLAGAAADPDLMPDFPGLADAENCREWEPGTPVDLDRIRDRDEEYWDEHRGTPKAFLRLAEARELWTSRFGELTAVRFDDAAGERVLSALRSEVDPRELGLFFLDLRAGKAAAGTSATDFGGLFIGLSLFLIVAALLLTAQLFLFGVEERSAELGLLSAVGFTRGSLARVFLGEAAVLAAAGGALGCVLGLAYTQAVLRGLATLWKGAVGGIELEFHAAPATLALGWGLALACILATVWWTLRKRLRVDVTRLLASRQGADAAPSTQRGRLGLVVAAVLAVLAAALALTIDATTGAAAAGAFFGAGAALLTAGLLACRAALHVPPSRAARGLTSVTRLGWTNGRRRPGRSLATVAVMAIGTFLVVAVGANQKGPTRNAQERDSGTGGFALYGSSSLPVTQDLATVEGREFFALDAEDLEGVEVLPLRVLEGDDASCLNLAQPRAPRLLGVDPDALAERGAFPFAGGLTAAEGWRLLEPRGEDGAVPAIGDTTSLTWQLKKSVGDSVEYTDERGETFQVRIVAALQDTVLQGDLLIANAHFEDLYPTRGGSRRFLIDAPPERVDEVRDTLSRALSDVGLALERTGERLDGFHAVQNTYLVIFQLLGALGLLLGSVGLGLVVLRNTLERRGELAVVAALGFTRRKLRWLLLSEYGALHLVGLAVGCVAAGLAVLPALRTPGADASLTHVLLLVLLIALNGLLWIFLAARAVGGRRPTVALGED